jgi:hypothetical protein
MYRILGWFPQKRTAGASFSVLLKKEWFEKVKTCKLNQEKIDNIIKNLGKQMLEGNGWSNIDDPRSRIRVFWDDGMPTIQVPGSACTLGYESYSQFGAKEGEIILHTHNMDTLSQASLALTIFLKIADYVELQIG